MKLLQELIRLNEGTHTIQGNVNRLDDLRGVDGKYLTGTVDVTEHVSLNGQKLERLPVRFGVVGGGCYCSGNRLTSLEGVPSAVGGNFSCSDNRLTSLEGAPSSVGRNFYCSGNRLTSLVGVHRILRQIAGGLYIWNNPIESGGIGLILVEGLTKIDANQPAFKIINEYLGQGHKGVLRCQEALHDAGFEEYARL